MPFKNRSRNSHDDDRDLLIENEQQPPTINNQLGANSNAGVFVDDDDDFVVGNSNEQRFVVATLPEPLQTQQNFQTVQLERQSPVSFTEAPKDFRNFTYIVFYLLGTATMTPWNFFITAEDYWMYKFRNTSINGSSLEPIELTPLQKSFTCDLTLTASISGTIFLILNAIYGQRISLKVKMQGTLIVILIVFMITTAFVEINTDGWQEQFFLITLFTVIIINICAAVMSGVVFGFAGLFPSQYITALVSGQALGGIFTALAFIMVLAFGTDADATALIFFNIGSFIILLSIITYAIMSRMPFFQYYIDGGDKFIIVGPSTSQNNSLDEGVSLEPNTRDVFGKIYLHIVAITLLYATTLSVYPAVSTLIQSQNFGDGSAWSNIYYMPVTNYLFFNSGDYFGRILAGAWEKPRENCHTVLLLIFLRFLYVPFFLCSNTDLHEFLPVIVHSDVTFIIMILTFGITNGYLTNIILIMVPRAVKQHEKELASSIMAASLSFGIAFGSMISMAFVQLL